MEIIHRIIFDGKDEVDDLLDSNAIRYRKSKFGENSYLIIVEISESHPAWNMVQEVYKLKGHHLDIEYTVFTNEEILAAEWVRLVPRFEQGYPQPVNSWEKITYGNSICPICGIGFRQISPLRLAKEPSLGENDFFHPLWMYGVFCTQAIVSTLSGLGSIGIEVWDAIIHHLNKPSTGVSQLYFPCVAKPGLAEADKLKPCKCKLCGLTKYAYQERGYMHIQKEALNNNIDAQVTDEWFGSGTFTGHREILISNRFAKLIIDNKWKGVSLKPILLN
jgi:hypothetical protein